MVSYTLPGMNISLSRQRIWDHITFFKDPHIYIQQKLKDLGRIYVLKCPA